MQYHIKKDHYFKTFDNNTFKQGRFNLEQNYVRNFFIYFVQIKQSHEAKFEQILQNNATKKIYYLLVIVNKRKMRFVCGNLLLFYLQV